MPPKRNLSIAAIDGVTPRQRNSAIEACQRQSRVIEFRHGDGNGPIDIQRHLVRVYKVHRVYKETAGPSPYCAVDASAVSRWTRRFESGDKDVDDKSRSVRRRPATTTENEVRLGGPIQVDRRTTLNERHVWVDGVSVHWKRCCYL